MASTNKTLFASQNHGQPAIAATAKPGEFTGKGVVAAKEVKPSNTLPGTKPTGTGAPRTPPPAAPTASVKPAPVPPPHPAGPTPAAVKPAPVPPSSRRYGAGHSQACTSAAAPRWSDPSRGQTRPRTAASSRRYGAGQAKSTSNSSGQTVTSGPGKARRKASVPAWQNNDTCRLQIARSARVDRWLKIKNPRRRRLNERPH
jgi:hypothetical protein